LWINAESLYRMKAELVATDQEWDARIGKADAFVNGAMALNQRAQQHATTAQKWLSPLEPPPPLPGPPPHRLPPKPSGSL
jgi:hypothetical protein